MTVLVMLAAVLALFRWLVLGPYVVAHVCADETTGRLNQLKAALYYFCHPTELKTVYIREGKFSYRPVHLVRNSDEESLASGKHPETR